MANKNDDYRTEIEDIASEIDYRLDIISLDVIEQSGELLNKSIKVLQKSNAEESIKELNKLKKYNEAEKEKLLQLNKFHERYYECKFHEQDKIASMKKLVDDIKKRRDSGAGKQSDDGEGFKNEEQSVKKSSINTEGLDKAIASLKKLMNDNEKGQDSGLIGLESSEGFKNMEQRFKKQEVSCFDANQALMILEQAKEVIHDILGTETDQEK